MCNSRRQIVPVFLTLDQLALRHGRSGHEPTRITQPIVGEIVRLTGAVIFGAVLGQFAGRPDPELGKPDLDLLEVVLSNPAPGVFINAVFANGGALKMKRAPESRLLLLP